MHRCCYGRLIAQEEFSINKEDDANSLSDKLITLSNKMLLKTLKAYIEGQIDPWPQDPTIEPTYSQKLSKADGQIDWSKTADQLEKEVRAYSIWPKSYTTLANKNIVITKAHVAETEGRQGIAYRNGKDLAVYCGSGTLVIDKLKVAGKPEMNGQAFLNGYGQNIY